MSSNVKFSQVHLNELVQNNDSGVVVEANRSKYLNVSPFQLTNLKEFITQYLDSLVAKYDPELSGIILSHKKIRISPELSVQEDGTNKLPYVADIYVFKPKIGSILTGVVNKKSEDHIGCLVHQVFNIAIPRPERIGEGEGSTWKGSALTIGQDVRFKVVGIDMSEAIPYIRGELLDTGTNVAENSSTCNELLSKNSDSDFEPSEINDDSEEDTFDVSGVRTHRPDSKVHNEQITSGSKRCLLQGNIKSKENDLNKNKKSLSPRKNEEEKKNSNYSLEKIEKEPNLLDFSDSKITYRKNPNLHSKAVGNVSNSFKNDDSLLSIGRSTTPANSASKPPATNLSSEINILLTPDKRLKSVRFSLNRNDLKGGKTPEILSHTILDSNLQERNQASSTDLKSPTKMLNLSRNSEPLHGSSLPLEQNIVQIKHQKPLEEMISPRKSRISPKNYDPQTRSSVSSERNSNITSENSDTLRNNQSISKDKHKSFDSSSSSKTDDSAIFSDLAVQSPRKSIKDRKENPDEMMQSKVGDGEGESKESNSPKENVNNKWVEETIKKSKTHSVVKNLFNKSSCAGNDETDSFSAHAHLMKQEKLKKDEHQAMVEDEERSPTSSVESDLIKNTTGAMNDDRTLAFKRQELVKKTTNFKSSSKNCDLDLTPANEMPLRKGGEGNEMNDSSFFGKTHFPNRETVESDTETPDESARPFRDRSSSICEESTVTMLLKNAFTTFCRQDKNERKSVDKSEEIVNEVKNDGDAEHFDETAFSEKQTIKKKKKRDKEEKRVFKENSTDIEKKESKKRESIECSFVIKEEVGKQKKRNSFEIQRSFNPVNDQYTPRRSLPDIYITDCQTSKHKSKKKSKIKIDSYDSDVEDEVPRHDDSDRKRKHKHKASTDQYTPDRSILDDYITDNQHSKHKSKKRSNKDEYNHFEVGEKQDDFEISKELGEDYKKIKKKLVDVPDRCSHERSILDGYTTYCTFSKHESKKKSKQDENATDFVVEKQENLKISEMLNKDSKKKHKKEKLNDVPDQINPVESVFDGYLTDCRTSKYKLKKGSKQDGYTTDFEAKRLESPRISTDFAGDSKKMKKNKKSMDDAEQYTSVLDGYVTDCRTSKHRLKKNSKQDGFTTDFEAERLDSPRIPTDFAGDSKNMKKHKKSMDNVDQYTSVLDGYVTDCRISKHKSKKKSKQDGFTTDFEAERLDSPQFLTDFAGDSMKKNKHKKSDTSVLDGYVTDCRTSKHKSKKKFSQMKNDGYATDFEFDKKSLQIPTHVDIFKKQHKKSNETLNVSLARNCYLKSHLNGATQIKGDPDVEKPGISDVENEFVNDERKHRKRKRKKKIKLSLELVDGGEVKLKMGETGSESPKTTDFESLTMIEETSNKRGRKRKHSDVNYIGGEIPELESSEKLKVGSEEETKKKKRRKMDVELNLVEHEVEEFPNLDIDNNLGTIQTSNSSSKKKKSKKRHSEGVHEYGVGANNLFEPEKLPADDNCLPHKNHQSIPLLNSEEVSCTRKMKKVKKNKTDKPDLEDDKKRMELITHFMNVKREEYKNSLNSHGIKRRKKEESIEQVENCDEDILIPTKKRKIKHSFTRELQQNDEIQQGEDKQNLLPSQHQSISSDQEESVEKSKMKKKKRHSKNIDLEDEVNSVVERELVGSSDFSKKEDRRSGGGNIISKELSNNYRINSVENHVDVSEAIRKEKASDALDMKNTSPSTNSPAEMKNVATTSRTPKKSEVNSKSPKVDKKSRRKSVQDPKQEKIFKFLSPMGNKSSTYQSSNEMNDCAKSPIEESHTFAESSTRKSSDSSFNFQKKPSSGMDKPNDKTNEKKMNSPSPTGIMDSKKIYSGDGETSKTPKKTHKRNSHGKSNSLLELQRKMIDQILQNFSS